MDLPNWAIYLIIGGLIISAIGHAPVLCLQSKTQERKNKS
jgi:hypothetical protein